MPRGQCPRTFPKQPGVWVGGGSLRCPSRYVNKGKEMSSQKSRGPQLGTWASRCGWGSGDSISGGWGWTEAGTFTSARPAFPAPLRGALSDNRTQPAPHVGVTQAACAPHRRRRQPSEGAADTRTLCILCISACVCTGPGVCVCQHGCEGARGEGRAGILMHKVIHRRQREFGLVKYIHAYRAFLLTPASSSHIPPWATQQAPDREGL